VKAAGLQSRLPPLVLASASPRRVELLRGLGLAFEVIPSSAEEAHHRHLTARELCQFNAWRKALAVARRHPSALVLGADTLVCLGTELFGKPATIQDASRMLRVLSGETHQVITGVCLLNLSAGRRSIFADQTAVTFKRLSDATIRRYLSLVHTLDKAGAYAIQEHGHLIVERISGSRSNVVGLPVERVTAALRGWISRARKPRGA